MENKVLRRLLIVVTIIAILAFLACFGFFIYATVYYTMHKNANFVEEQATIVEYKKIDYKNYSCYNLYYEYIADDGTKYSGLYEGKIMNFDYVQDKLNTKITIYVDHNLHIHRLHKDDFDWSAIAFLCPASAVLFVFALVPLLKLIKYYKTKKQKSNNGIVQEQPEQKLEKLEKVENNKNENVKKIKKPSYSNLASLVGVFLFGFMLLGMILLYPQVIEDKKIYEKANFVKEYATVAKYERDLVNGNVLYSTYYVYEAEEATYKGCWQANMQSEEEAKAQVGKKVPIYVDHELKIHTKKLNKNFKVAFIGITTCTIIFSIGFVGSMVVMIRYIINCNKWKRYQESIKE